MGQYLQLVLIWMSFTLAFTSESKVNRNLNDFQKVEIEFDVYGNVAQIIYNDTTRVKAKVLYMEKKKMVAYKDEENGRCLLENIKNHGTVMRIKDFGNEEFYSKSYQDSRIPLQMDKVRKIAGKRIVVFCRKLPVILLKEPGEIVRHAIENTQRVKRENYYERRKNESEISHQITKKLGKRQYPSASAKIVPSGGIDYHARIKNNLQPGMKGMHPIDITSSVTITTGSATPHWSYSSSTGRQYPASVIYQNDTNTSHATANSHQFSMAPSFYNTSHISHGPSAHSLVKPLHSPNIHPEQSPYSSVPGQSFQSHHPPSASSKSHVAHHNVTSFGHKSSAADVGQYYTESKVHVPSYYVPSISSRGSYALTHPTIFQPQHGHHQGYFPPSSSSKIHHSTLHNQNSSQHESQFSPGRSVSVYAPQFFPSETRHTPPHSRVGYEQPYAHKIDAKRTFSHDSSAAYYPPSSQSHNYHLPHIGGHTGTQPSIQSVTQYPPSSSSKIHSSVNHFSSSGRSAILTTQTPINELHYQTAPVGMPERPSIKSDGSINENYPQSHAKNIPYSLANVGPTSVSPTPLGARNSQSVYNQPSSEGKMHYLPSNIGHDTHPSEHIHSFPPSSTSKLNYSPIHHIEFPSERPISHAVNQLPSMQFSSTPKTYYAPTTESQSRVQIPQPPSDRHPPVQFPPSSTSKTYQFSSHAHTVPVYYPNQHYPPSTSNNHQNNRYGVAHESTLQHHADAAYYLPSSVSKVQNFSSYPSTPNRHIQSPEFYPPSSTSKVYHVPASVSGHDSQDPGRQPLQGKSLTPTRDAYYPPSSSSKTLVHSKNSMLHSHSNGEAPQHPYYGPSSYHIQKQSSHSQAISGNIPSSSNGHSFYSSTQYPPSATSKFQPQLHHNTSRAGQRVDHDYNINNLHPMLQHSSLSGSQHFWPDINSHNDSSLTRIHNLQSGVYSQESHSPQYPPSSSSSAHSQRNGQALTPFGQSSHSAKTQIPCQISPRSTYSITTRTILTPNGLVQRPAAIKTSEESPCGETNMSGSVSYNNGHLPCYASGRYGQTARDKIPCNVNPSFRNMRKSQRSITAPSSGSLPNMKISHFANSQQGGNQSLTTPRSNNQYNEEFTNSDGVIIADVAKSQTKLIDGINNEELNEKFEFSELKEIAPETVNSSSQRNEDILPEFSDRNEGVEIIEEKKEENIHSKPVKYQELIDKEKNLDEVEEQVKKGDVLEPGDRILGRDGYTILDGFRGRVVSVTGQVGKVRAETTKESRITKTRSSSNNSNSGKFRYSSELGRYVKDNGNFSSCNGELTFTCTEFLGSNGRAKICKPNPRRKPDGSPC